MLQETEILAPQTQTAPNFFVRDIPIYGDTLLAPMDGYSDWPFRSLCKMLGSAMSYTEFVPVERIVLAKVKKPINKLYYEPAERPVTFQIYGDDPDMILEAALRIRDLGPDIIDLNMGCPAKKVAHRGAGVGMMMTPLKIARTFKMLTAKLDIPITGKMRLGWENYRSYKLIARIVEENGGSLIALHGRTKEQSYSGLANWDAVAEIKSIVKIPVIGSGDIRKVADIARMRAYSGCDAVMVGRGAIANPWIFSGLDRDQVSPAEVKRIVQEHLRRNTEFYGLDTGHRLFRKHAVQYFVLRSLSREDRKRILQARPSGEFIQLVESITNALA